MKYLIIKMRAGGGGTSAEGQVHLGHRERPRGALDCGQLRQLHCPLELQVDFLVNCSAAPLTPACCAVPALDLCGMSHQSLAVPCCQHTSAPFISLRS